MRRRRRWHRQPQRRCERFGERLGVGDRAEASRADRRAPSTSRGAAAAGRRPATGTGHAPEVLDDHGDRLVLLRDRRTGERRLELDEVARSEPGVGAALQWQRDLGRRTGADDRLRLHAVEHAQRDAQVRVGEDVLVDRPGRPLRGEDQMDTEAAAALGDVDDPGDEVGHLLDECGELVDDDHEGRRRLLGVALEHLRRGPWPCPRAAACGG